jgi:hypothetical protein
MDDSGFVFRITGRYQNHNESRRWRVIKALPIGRPVPFREAYLVAKEAVPELTEAEFWWDIRGGSVSRYSVSVPIGGVTAG